MKPKEKAIELVDNYLASIIINIKQNIEVCVIDASKQCSLIGISEIIEELGDEFPRAIEYWKEVRKEIIKL
tara:strand:- start:228 stop:440 length:213 start_codon:yes stop_codon:yes gene_type:complete